MLPCFTFQLGCIVFLKSIFLALTRCFIEKQLFGTKFARNDLKTPVKKQKFSMHNLLSFALNFQVTETSRRIPNSQNNFYLSNSSLLHLRKTQNSYQLIDPAYSMSLLTYNLYLINLWTKEYCSVPLFNLSFTIKLIQRT